MKSQPRYKKGDKIGGRYLVHKALMGGMGEVYLCLDLEQNYPYALKTFQQRYITDTQKLRKAFEQEVATWIALEKHPNIVRCFWMQTFDTQPFMALEWIAGEDGKGTDLRGWLRHGPLDLKLALQIAIDICNGLIYARVKQPGLVHRDLKPENILMAQGGLAKITDFGLTKVGAQAELAVTQEGVMHGRGGITGTPAYMAPEQWRGETVNERTDIYALGCILYELVTGSVPFVFALSAPIGASVQRWLRTLQHAHESGQVMALPSGLPTALNELVHLCLAKRPEERYASLATLLIDLTNLYQTHCSGSPPVRPTLDAFSASDYNNRGATYNMLQEHVAALADYDHAIELDPTVAQAYSNRGVTYSILKEYKAALADFGRALNLDPANAQTYSNRGLTYQRLQKYVVALADFGRALKLEPTLAEAYGNRGDTYAILGKHKEALTDYSQAISLDPTLAKAYGNRGVTYVVLGKPDMALADYSQAIALDPTYTQAYFNRGATYKAMGKPNMALADYNQAIALDPTYAQAYNNRGNTYTVLGRPEMALADYNQAIALDPTYAQAYYNRGNAFMELDQPEVALADYNRAIALEPTYAQVYLNIGVLFVNHEKLAKALPFFEKAAQLGDPQGAPYAAQVRHMLGMEPAPQADVAQQAFVAFQQADSSVMMQEAAARFPSLLQADFMAGIEQAIAQQVPSTQRPAFEQRLGWLRQIVNRQHSRSTP